MEIWFSPPRLQHCSTALHSHAAPQPANIWHAVCMTSCFTPHNGVYWGFYKYWPLLPSFSSYTAIYDVAIDFNSSLCLLLYLIYLSVCLMFETCQLWGMEDTCALPRQSLQFDIITPPSSLPSCQPSPDLNIWTPATGDGRLAVSLQIVPSPAAAGMNLQCLAILCFAAAGGQ